jgi:ribonuclease HI
MEALMTATTIAAQFAHTLGQHGFTATLHPAPTPNGYGHKIALATDTRVPLGHLVIYAGKQGSRYVTNELRSVSPLQLAAIATAWTTCGSSVPHATSPASATPPINAAASPNIELWVDGACLQDSGKLRFGWAYIIRRGQAILHQISGPTIPHDAVSHRNVAAEIQAVLQGLQHCLEFNYTPVTVCYDYEGLEAWATGRWKAKTPFTIAYQQRIRSLPFTITWKKIPAHTGVPMNELVDSLANSAASVSSERHQLPINSGISPT